MLNKKGAMEMSVNTIVVIVIGVTLLSLGLMFVRGLFQNLDTQSSDIFSTSENELSKIATHNEKLSVQQQVQIGQNDQAFFKIWVVNLDDTEKDFKITIEPSKDNEFGDKVKLSLANSEETLDVGEESGFVAGVETIDNTPLTAGGYKITVTADGKEYAESGFFVNVKK